VLLVSLFERLRQLGPARNGREAGTAVTLARISQSAPTARFTSGGRIHPLVEPEE
jgi:hypothetical protein